LGIPHESRTTKAGITPPYGSHRFRHHPESFARPLGADPNEIDRK
jgi:hypothetical protein